MAAESDGYFVSKMPRVAEGLRYAYRLGDDPLELPDPASRWQPDGVSRPSAVLFPERFAWTDHAWRGLDRQTLVIYELHVGTFTPEGTFEAIIPRLAELRDLGVTAIEIMPIAQFPGARNWGYDGVHPSAAQNSYGGPLGLQKLVDAAHCAGVGVLLDVVYNHWGPEGNYLARFGPYFTERYHTPWGRAVNYDGPDSDPVRHFVIDSACQWIRDFHIDGLRLDAVQTIYDRSQVTLIAELQEAVQDIAAAVGRTALVTVETDENDVRHVTSRGLGGHSLDGVWSDDFHHAVHSALTGERDGYYSDFGAPQQIAKSLNDVFCYDGCHSPYRRRRHGTGVGSVGRERFVACIQNHDQVGNRALGERLSKLLPPEAQRLAAALLLLSPFTPLLFMGEEYAEEHPFLFFCSFSDPQLREAVRSGRLREFAELAFKWQGSLPDPNAEETFTAAKLSWKWPAGSYHGGMRNLYQVLLAARRNWPSLLDRRFTRARLGSAGEPSLILERGESPRLTAWANLTSVPQPIAAKERPGMLLLSTAEKRFGGAAENRVNLKELMPYEVAIWGQQSWLEAR
jgi:maltooligosyltrehalose trehalohydrolase